MSLNEEFHNRVHTLMMELLPYMDYTGAQRVERILHKWFRKNFEVYSLQQAVDKEMYGRPDFDKFEEHILAQMSAQIGKSIFERSGFSKTKIPNEKHDPLKPSFSETSFGPHLEISCSVLAMLRKPKR